MHIIMTVTHAPPTQRWSSAQSASPMHAAARWHVRFTHCSPGSQVELSRQPGTQVRATQISPASQVASLKHACAGRQVPSTHVKFTPQSLSAAHAGGTVQVP